MVVNNNLDVTSVGFQPVRQAPPPPHRQLFGGTSSIPPNNYFSKSSQTGASLQMERPSAGLARMDRGELLPRNQKDFKGFKTIKEIKLSKTRMLVQPGKNGAPDTIVAIFMRRDIDDIVLAFKNKYK